MTVLLIIVFLLLFTSSCGIKRSQATVKINKPPTTKRPTPPVTPPPKLYLNQERNK